MKIRAGIFFPPHSGAVSLTGGSNNESSGNYFIFGMFDRQGPGHGITGPAELRESLGGFGEKRSRIS